MVLNSVPGESNLEPDMPEVCTVDMLTYLDRPRESGRTNMLGAGAYLEDNFNLNKRDARNVLIYWMETFSDKTVEERRNGTE